MIKQGRQRPGGPATWILDAALTSTYRVTVVECLALVDPELSLLRPEHPWEGEWLPGRPEED